MCSLVLNNQSFVGKGQQPFAFWSASTLAQSHCSGTAGYGPRARAALSDPFLWLLCLWVSKLTLFVPNTMLPCYPRPTWPRGSRRGRTRGYSLWRTVGDLITGQLALSHHPPPSSTPRSRLGTGIYWDRSVSGTTSELRREGGWGDGVSARGSQAAAREMAPVFAEGSWAQLSSTTHVSYGVFNTFS